MNATTTPFRFALTVALSAAALVAQEDPKEAAKAREDAFKEAGLVEVNGVWIEKDHKADAKKGIYHHNGEVVTRREKLALQTGKVRHPETGEMIAEADKDKAVDLYPTHDGRWLNEEEADRYHKSSSYPWVYRTKCATLVTWLPITDIRMKAQPAVDEAIKSLLPLTGATPPHPENRPLILVTTSDDQYRVFGNDWGGAGSAYAVFRALDYVTVPNVRGEQLPVVANWHKDWGVFNVRHAAGLAWVSSLCETSNQDAPEWFLRAAGGFAARNQSDHYTAWFGKQLVGRGGVPEIGPFLRDFTVNGEMTYEAMADGMFVAGLLLNYGLNGSNGKIGKERMEITEAFQKGKGLEKAIHGFAGALSRDTEGVKGFLQKIIREQG